MRFERDRSEVLVPLYSSSSAASRPDPVDEVSLEDAQLIREDADRDFQAWVDFAKARESENPHLIVAGRPRPQGPDAALKATQQTALLGEAVDALADQMAGGRLGAPIEELEKELRFSSAPRSLDEIEELRARLDAARAKRHQYRARALEKLGVKLNDRPIRVTPGAGVDGQRAADWAAAIRGVERMLPANLARSLTGEPLTLTMVTDRVTGEERLTSFRDGRLLVGDKTPGRPEALRELTAQISYRVPELTLLSEAVFTKAFVEDQQRHAARVATPRISYCKGLGYYAIIEHARFWSNALAGTAYDTASGKESWLARVWLGAMAMFGVSEKK